MIQASTAYLNEVLKGVGKDRDQAMLRRLPVPSSTPLASLTLTLIQSVTIDQIRAAISKYFLPIFSPKTAIGAVSVSSGKADEVEAGFKKMGFEVERKELPMLGGEKDESHGSEGSEDSGEESGEEKQEDGMEGVTSP